MNRVLTALILGALCAVLASAAPKDKDNPQAGCEEYVSERWDAEQGAIHTSQRNYRRLVELGLVRGLAYSDSVREIPILYWKYSRKKSKKCRSVFSRSNGPDYDELTAKALKMETDSQKIDDAWFRVTSYVGAMISDSSARQPMQREQEQGVQPQNRNGCGQAGSEGERKPGEAIPPASTGPCP